MPIDLAMLNEMIAVAHRLLTGPDNEPGEHDQDRTHPQASLQHKFNSGTLILTNPIPLVFISGD